MRIDIFDAEQKIYDEAAKCVRSFELGAEIEFAMLKLQYATLTHEYGRLLKQLRRSTRIADMTTIGLHESNLDLSDKVHYDAQTGIYNRRFMDEAMERVIKSLARSESSLSILMIDIDYFKKYNDTYGHSEGDTALRSVAQTIKDSLSRAVDFVIRYGGEEFTVILPDTDKDGAELVANKILENIRKLNITHSANDIAPYLSLSIGGTTINTVERTHDGTAYIRHADAALYTSKNSGRNRYTFTDFSEGAEQQL
jgi:diguanylate cyclase (GGDEF)-like protein